MAQRTTLDEDDVLDLPVQETELTISATTLLFLFFALVVLCGLFFGLGYSLGRREPATATLNTPTSGSIGGLASHLKPSATQQNTPPPSAQPASTTPPLNQTWTAETNSHPSSQPASNSASTTTAPPPSAAPALTQLPPSQSTAQPTVQPSVHPALPTQQIAEPAPAGIMVQIAAVRDPADADVLAAALRKRGYAITTSHIASDSFIHVQVGPFATRADAAAMQQRLLKDGYNAILR